MSDSTDIGRIPPAPTDGRGIDMAGRIGNVNLQVRETIGKRPEQQDVIFHTLTPVNTAAEASALLQTAFAAADKETHNYDSGSTGTVAVITKDRHVTIGHLGDSPVVLFVVHTDKSVTPHLLTKPHKPDDPEEKLRIESAGGFVERKRVNGRLAMSRAFGDRHLGQAVSKNPDINSFDLSRYVKSGEKAYLCVSCDGLYEGDIPENSYAKIIRQALERGQEGRLANIMKDCASHKGSRDNISVVLAEIPDALIASVALGVCDGHGSSSKTAEGAAEVLGHSFKKGKVPDHLSIIAPVTLAAETQVQPPAGKSLWTDRTQLLPTIGLPGQAAAEPEFPYPDRWSNLTGEWRISMNGYIEIERVRSFLRSNNIEFDTWGADSQNFTVTGNKDRFLELLRAARAKTRDLPPRA